MNIKIGFLLFLFISNTYVFAQTKDRNSIKIGFMGNNIGSQEKKSTYDFLSEHGSYDIVDISTAGLNKEKLSEYKLTHIWIHQLLKIDNDYKKEEFGKLIKHFVENGGNLILSMEAVRLLNLWGIEKNQFQIKTDTITDNGFGRPRGFHAFKSHPVFEGLHGGVYSWKSNEDHIVRKIGFFGHNLPDTTIAKVLGVEWTYITFHENNKLVMEYHLGKGKILAIGAFSYFGRENYNTLELHRFYSNVIDYMAGNIKNIESNYWDYSTQKVLPFQKKFPSISTSSASKWELPKLSIILKKQKATNDMAIMAGRRITVMGKQKGGIDEIWTNPFMSFRDIDTGVLLNGTKKITWLKDLTPSIISSPELLIREYRIRQTILKEIIAVSMDKPIGVVHYEWEGENISKIFMKYTSNFRYMWPYSEKVSSTIHYKWAAEMNAAIASAQSNELVSIMGFSSPPKTSMVGQYGAFDLKGDIPQGIKTNKKQISGFFSFDTKSIGGKLNAYLVGGEKGLDRTLETFIAESGNFNQLFKKSSTYYNNLLNNSLMLTTPNEKFNIGYKWALLRTDQFFQKTPDIGTSMVAGFGTTDRGWDGGQQVSGRPGYAWYFGRDAQWCGFAVNAYGGHKYVKQMLEVFSKFQNLNGKIYHELTTSGAVHYDASDSTPLFVVLAAHYLKYSGDVEFIRKIWPSLKMAMDFCYSTDTDEDGLIETTNVGHGWIEGGPLFGAHTEVYLAGCWAAALDAASYIANAISLKDLSTTYKTDANEVKRIIDKDFWNKEGQYFYNGKMRDGSYMEEQTVLAGVPVYFDAVKDSDKAFKTAASFANNQYSTDWGVRILPQNSKNYNPGSYHSGMVWPLFGGWASLSEYKTGNYVSGYNHLMNNLLEYNVWNLGSIEETLNGMNYRPAGVCSQQGWSETMALQPIYEGMLGLAPNALTNTISLSPHFPWHWNEVKVDNIIFGSHKIGFKMSKSEKSTIFDFKNINKKEILLKLTPSLPLGTIIKKVLINGNSVDYQMVVDSESISLQIAPFKLNDLTSIEIMHKKGIGAIPIINHPKPGDANKGAKIISQHLSSRVFDVVIEGLPNNTYQFKVMSNLKIKKIENGHILTKDDNVYTLEADIPSASKNYVCQKVSIYL